MRPCFIFLESAIEPIPETLRNHPLILKESKKRGKKAEEILLDDSKHHTIMRRIKNSRKRGRADIIHVCLLSLLDSRVGRVSDIYIHTINDRIIRVSNKVRLPRNYNRFIGLMEDLLSKKKIVADEILLEIMDTSLEELLSQYSDRNFYLLTEKGEFHEKLRLEDPLIMIGAFPHGDFEDVTLKTIRKFNPKLVSIGAKSFTSLYITNKVICMLEDLNPPEGEHDE
jgi:rRNA small subunit pseudouridine methyltransferase Nep1